VFAPGNKAQGRLLPSHGLFDLIEQRDLLQHFLSMGDPSFSNRFTKRRRTWIQQWASCHGPLSRAISVTAL